MTAAKDRYLDLIDATLRHALTHRPPPATDGPLTMELALPAIGRRLGTTDVGATRVAIERFTHLRPGDPVTDGAGQTRSTYLPLLLRMLAPFGDLTPLLAASKDRVLPLLKRLGSLPASDGAAIAGHTFDALACSVSDSTWSSQAIARLIATQNADGTFLTRTNADQLEPAWYHELALLHAVNLYARQTDDAAALAAAARSARYHAAEVQPDHASSHPFGLAALLDDPDGIHLADMMLHAAGVQQPATMDAVSLVLLFDALESSGRVGR